ncbi:MAG: NAD(P)H-quinone oxidoreductase [Actinomycetota bacterium]|nr:NAD(P)H-quinone oxidoreductase [Actinomycetota bacterium]
MKAVTLPRFGGPEVLTWADLPDPTPAPGEVLVEVAATAVNRADLMQRAGHYPPPPGAPAWPGLECSGRITGLGEGVIGWAMGDQVCALLSGGGYAEQVTVPAGQLLPIPAGVSLVDAAGLPEVCCTVWSNVFQTAHLAAGEVFLVHGGASGIGTIAIQLARSTGARVFCTAGGERKRERCRALGAERAIDYREEDFVSVLRSATGGHGADVVLDNMGAAYLGRNVDVLAVGGRLVVIGLQGGREGPLDLAMLLGKRASVTATTLRGRPADEKAGIVAGVRAQVWPLIAAGQVRPVIDRVLPLPEAAQAHRVVEASEHVGKVLLAV